MDVNEVLSEVRDALSAKWVFGHPIHQGGVTLVPVARVRGAGGGGGGAAPKGMGEGSGSGFGLSARPAGAYVLRGGRVQWRPAVDANRVILGAQVLAGLLILARSWVLLARSFALRRRASSGDFEELRRRVKALRPRKGLLRRMRFA